MFHRFGIFLAVAFASAPVHAQSPTSPSPEPAVRRWLDVQNFTVFTRYRFIESNRGVVSSNDMQYKETFRARFNIDREKRYAINVGAFSGSNFIGTWDNTGLGSNEGDYHSHYVKQLFGSAAPIDGLEIQAGGIYVVRGENTEYTTYDDDGYLMGERISIRRPAQLFVDELTVTQAALAGTSTPNIFKRWDSFAHQHYTQLLAAKRFSQRVSGSVDFTRANGADTVHAAVALRFKPTAPLSALRYEQYGRVNASAAAGFAITAERPIAPRLRLLGGYATIDESFGALNSDRIQRGRRVFLIANLALRGPLAASFFVTQALSAPYTISNRTRFDAILQYDVLAALRQAGKL